MRTFVPVFLLSAIATASAQVPPETSSVIKALHDWSTICEPDGLLLWHHSLCGPIVLVDPSTRASVANRPDPNNQFREYQSVYLGQFPAQFTPTDTAIMWGGQQWSNLLLPLPADRFHRLALLAHESFHRIQPALHLNASDAPDACLDTEPGRLWFRLELRALARALRSSDNLARQSAVDAMLFRLRRQQLCTGSAALDSAMEKQEGLAQYTGEFIALRETGEDVSREARFVEAFEDNDAFARSFAYATGPALGLLLDRYLPGWRDRAVETPPAAMLISALHVQTPPDLQRAAELRASVYGYPAVVAAEQEREERHEAFLADLKREFLDGPILDFPPAPNMNRSFNPSTLMPFPPHGTFYPTGTFTANWGKLQVTSGGALVTPDNLGLRVSAPTDPATRPVHGDGWVLELAPGWTLRPATKAGSYTVVPPGK